MTWPIVRLEQRLIPLSLVRMRYRILSTALTLLFVHVAGSTCGGQVPGATRFVSPDSTYTVLFPGHEPQPGSFVPGTTKQTQFYVNTGGAQFSVAVFENDYYRKTNAATILKNFAATRMGGFAPAAAVVDSAIVVDGVSGTGGRIAGTWLKAPMSEQRTRVFRAFVKDGKLYEVWAFTLGAGPLPDFADEFVKSFHFCRTPADCR